MPKRKAEEPFTWHLKAKKPRWPRFEEDWTEDDKRSAMNITSLNLEATKTMEDRVCVPLAVKCSVLIQALDLASFDDVPIDTTTAWEPLEPLSIVAVGYFSVRRSQVPFNCGCGLNLGGG